MQPNPSTSTAAATPACVVPDRAVDRFYSSPMGKFGSALKAKGWRATMRPRDAHLLWYQKKQHIPWSTLECWQRPNHLREERAIGNKLFMAERLRTVRDVARFLPETYVLSSSEDRARFAQAVGHEPDDPTTPSWVLKEPTVDGGKGVDVLFASAARQTLLLPDGSLAPGYEGKIAQRYVKDVLLLDGHKFDLRLYWLVASMRPPLVLYHDGTLRVSLDQFYNASHSRGQHLTNAAQQAGGHDRTRSSEASRQPMAALWTLLDHLKQTRPDWPASPRYAVECTIRDALANVWTAYAPYFQTVLAAAGREDDAFVLFGADFMVDSSLNLYLSEIQSGPGLPSNTAAVRRVMNQMMPDLATIVLHLHPTGVARSRWPLPQTSFEVIVNNTAIIPSPWCSRREDNFRPT